MYERQLQISREGAKGAKFFPFDSSGVCFAPFAPSREKKQ
jgi:hypothetical protein